MPQTTKRLLADTLIELLSQKPLDKITVKELVEKCHVNRQTFYYNFQDIYDLVGWIFTEKASAMLPKTEADWRGSLGEVLQSMLENKRLILNAYHALDYLLTQRYLAEWLRPTMAQIVEEQSRGHNIIEEDREFIVEVYVFGMIGIVMNWVEHGMDELVPRNFDKFLRLLEGSLESCVKKFEKT